MFIETLEFTIPVDLCDLFSTLKRGPRSNLEFPASVNSYGTTQDANIQVALRSNKLTFKVDGVSSNASMISKSECKTLKLSVFDVDCSLAPAEQNITMSVSENTHSVSHKRSYDFSVPVSSPAPKSRRISEPVQSRHIPQPENTSRPSNNSQSKSAVDPLVNVKQEPEDPDLIEIEPDSELNDIEPKKETPYMQIDFSSGVPHTQTSQAALDRLSHPQSSHSQSPASSSSSFHQNVPHVPDYAEPSTSQVHHGDQSADDFLVFQDDNDYGDDNDNEADYSNDENLQSGRSVPEGIRMVFSQTDMSLTSLLRPADGAVPNPNTCCICREEFKCNEDLNKHVITHMDIDEHPRCLFEDCGVRFDSEKLLQEHIMNLHRNDRPQFCPGCSKQFHFKSSLIEHARTCQSFMKVRLPEKKKNAQCDECGKFFASRQLKEEHVNSQHRGVIFACSCGQTYAYRTGLARHRKSSGHLPLKPKLQVLE